MLGEIKEDCQDRIYAIGLIHQTLYQSKDLARIHFKDYLQKLCHNLSKVHGAVERGIAIAVEWCDVVLVIDQGIAAGMVITELVTNALKHAFPDGEFHFTQTLAPSKPDNVSYSLNDSRIKPKIRVDKI